jgi:hypothetical protein
MKKKMTAGQWWGDLMEYERTHEIAFTARSDDGDADFIFFARETALAAPKSDEGWSPYIDNRPLFVASKPELREYKAVYVQNDDEIGLFSDEVVVNCAP